MGSCVGTKNETSNKLLPPSANKSAIKTEEILSSSNEDKKKQENFEVVQQRVGAVPAQGKPESKNQNKKDGFMGDPPKKFEQKQDEKKKIPERNIEKQGVPLLEGSKRDINNPNPEKKGNDKPLQKMPEDIKQVENLPLKQVEVDKIPEQPNSGKIPKEGSSLSSVKNTGSRVSNSSSYKTGEFYNLKDENTPRDGGDPLTNLYLAVDPASLFPQRLISLKQDQLTSKVKDKNPKNQPKEQKKVDHLIKESVGSRKNEVYQSNKSHDHEQSVINLDLEHKIGGNFIIGNPQIEKQVSVGNSGPAKGSLKGTPSISESLTHNQKNISGIYEVSQQSPQGCEGYKMCLNELYLTYEPTDPQELQRDLGDVPNENRPGVSKFGFTFPSVLKY